MYLGKGVQAPVFFVLGHVPFSKVMDGLLGKSGPGIRYKTLESLRGSHSPPYSPQANPLGDPGPESSKEKFTQTSQKG